MKTALITGVSGYLGTHLAKSLTLSGWKVLGLDVKTKMNPYLHEFYPCDVLDKELLKIIFGIKKIDVVFHLAGKIEVGESVNNPIYYFQNNTVGTCNVLEAMAFTNIENIVYSSTAGIYGTKSEKITEEDFINPFNNPYAGSKYSSELAIQQSGLKYAIFRYFNLAGADVDGEFGEDHEPETHLIPRIFQNINNFQIYGDIFNTPDGTCIRDYVHVQDVCSAHLSGANYLLQQKKSIIANLGTGEGHSVLQILSIIREHLKLNVQYKILPPRKGDPDCLVADISFAKNVLNYRPKYDIMRILETAYEWEKNRDRKN